MKEIMCFVCSQVIKWHFAARALFFCLIPFLFLEIQITGAKNFTNKNVSASSPQKLLWLCISPGLTQPLVVDWEVDFLFALARRFVSNAILKKMWIQGTYGDVWYQSYIAKICSFNIDLFISSTFLVSTLAFLQCYMVNQV